MIKLLVTLLFLGAVATAGFLLQQYDFPITAQFKGYLVETSMARLAIVTGFFLIVFYGLVKLLFWLKNSPRRMIQRIRKENEQQGYRNIMNGFSALAAGNTARAKKYSDKAHKALPKEPLVSLLQAQVAVYSGKRTEAEEYYKALTLSDEGKFAGFRGLISQSIANNQPDKALQIADDLLRDNPKSSWLNEALIDLSFRLDDWEKLERYLKKAEANKALEKSVLAEKFAVYYYVKAKIANEQGRVKDAEWLGERSLKYKPTFLPSAIFLSDLYIAMEDYKAAKKVIKKFWGKCTSPVFAKNYETALLHISGSQKSKKFKKLYDLNPDDAESVAAYAKVLIDEGRKDEAKEVIAHGLQIRETKQLCRLMAQVDDRAKWESRAEKAHEDKCWYCKITGARYVDWQPYSDSGELNTISWGFPPEMPRTILAENKFLL